MAVALFGKSVNLNRPGKKHSLGVVLLLLAVTKIKKDISWYISYYFLMFSEIFPRRAISCSLVVRWGYQH